MNLSTFNPSQRRARAFTLVEILTAVAITTIIVFALVSMFNTSIKALQTANRQTDIWEAARSTFGILKNQIGEVTTGDSGDRVNLFAANQPPLIVGGFDFRLQDIFLLSRENNQFNFTGFLVGKDLDSDADDVGVRTLYFYRTNYSAINGVVPDIDQTLRVPPLAVNKAVAALDQYLIDVANGITTNRAVSVLAKGIVHLRIVAYATDGRAFTNSNDLPNLAPPLPLPADHFIDADTVLFQGEMLPSSVDLEMFVLEPDRIAEYKSQGGAIARKNYLDKHVNSVQLFRTRIPVRRELLARQ